MKFLDSSQDSDYINLLKLPVINLAVESNNVRFNQATPTRSNQSLLSSLASSHLKRKASTPHPFAPGIRDTARKSLAAVGSPHRSVLTSSLKQSRPSDAANNSLISTNSKSVKFKLAEFTKKDECDLNSSSFNRSGDKSLLADLENDEPPVVDNQVECLDIQAKRLEFNEKEEQVDDNQDDEDYQMELDEESDESMTTRSKKARQSTPSPVKKSPRLNKTSPSPKIPSPSKSPAKSSPRPSPAKSPAATTLCAVTLNCLNETFETQEEINSIMTPSEIVDSEQVNSVPIISEEQKEEDRLAGSNFESEIDNEYLVRLNMRKTIRVSGLDQNEPADSHRSSSITHSPLSLPVKPAEIQTKDESSEESDQEEYKEEMNGMDTSSGEHRNTEPPIVEAVEMPNPTIETQEEEVASVITPQVESETIAELEPEPEVTTTSEIVNQPDIESTAQQEETIVTPSVSNTDSTPVQESEAEATSVTSNSTVVSSPIANKVDKDFSIREEQHEISSPTREYDLMSLPSLNMSANPKSQEEELNDSAGELNMSSISSRAVNDDVNNTTPTQSPGKRIEAEFNVTNTLTTVSGMTRTNSDWSLYSQISSVSEHYERMKPNESQNNTLTNEDDLDGAKPKRRQSNIKRRAPVRGRRTMEIKLEKEDDTVNESATTASAVGDDDDDDRASVASRVSLRRRRSDASSVASSASITVKGKHPVNLDLFNQISAFIEPVVATEKRLTRGRKLKSLVELPATEILPTHTEIVSSTKSTTVTRRNSSKKTAESSTSVVSTPVIMSASNLKKYNAIMEEQQPEGRTTTRSTRSRAAHSRSPSASSIVSVTSSVTSSVSTSLRPKRVASTRKKASQVEEKKEAEKTIIVDEDSQDSKLQLSPTNSVVSIASSLASTGRVTRRTTRKIKEETESVKKEDTTPSVASVTRSYSSRNYNLRSKLDTPKVEATVEDSCDSFTSATATTTTATSSTTTRVPTLRRARTARASTVKKEQSSDDLLPDLDFGSKRSK